MTLLCSPRVTHHHDDAVALLPAGKRRMCHLRGSEKTNWFGKNERVTRKRNTARALALSLPAGKCCSSRGSLLPSANGSFLASAEDHGSGCQSHQLREGQLLKASPQAGQPVSGGYTAKFDGQDSTVTGAPRDTISLKKGGNYTWTATTKKDGKVFSTSKSVVSKDGQTLTTTSTGTNEQGQKFRNVSVEEFGLGPARWCAPTRSRKSRRNVKLAPAPWRVQHADKFCGRHSSALSR